jgi:hypothetical protein
MRKVSTLVGLTVFALAGSAWAQEEAPAPAPEGAAAPAPAGDAAAAPAPAPEAAAAAPAPAPAAAGTSYVSRGLTQSAGNFQVTVPIVLNLSKSAVLKPVWVPLDLRYGITDQLEVYINHTAPIGPLASPGGVCLGGTSRGCAKLYNNVNIGVQFSILKDAALELAAIGALLVNSLDPSMLSADIGVNFKYATGPVAIKAAPQLGIGVTKRDQGNKEDIFVPVQVAFQATPELAAFLDAGITGPTSHFGDLWSAFVGVGASFAVLPNLDVGGEFMLPSVATGASGNKAFDGRLLGVFAQYRLK